MHYILEERKSDKTFIKNMFTLCHIDQHLWLEAESFEFLQKRLI